MSNKKTAPIALAGLAAPAGNAVKSIQANAGIRFILLGRPFVAAFTKTGSGDTQDIAFVIMPEPGSKSEPCTIQELCDGLNGVVSGATGDEQGIYKRGYGQPDWQLYEGSGSGDAGR